MKQFSSISNHECLLLFSLLSLLPMAGRALSVFPPPHGGRRSGGGGNRIAIILPILKKMSRNGSKKIKKGAD
jgi:hypothetical protein